MTKRREHVDVAASKRQICRFDVAATASGISPPDVEALIDELAKKVDLEAAAAEIAKRLRGKPGKPGPRAKVAHIIELPAIWMLVTAEERKHPKLKIPRICKELSQRKTIAKDLLDALPFGVMQEVADELIKRFHSAYYQKHGTLIRRYNEACQKFGKDSASLPGVQAPEKEFADFIASLMGND